MFGEAGRDFPLPTLPRTRERERWDLRNHLLARTTLVPSPACGGGLGRGQAEERKAPRPTALIDTY
ncbi:MAG: hypothetical protein B7Y12_09025 [Rhizobiales bacterium 24-66-13]|nr:MAG: hypothetical protein B7Z41_05985 [Rhizobiales bacterium 12-66-7]OYZ79015.1 MAG: hypothetical protein B7Y12_09025 [Rhizobiales bacterium 24-66-13]OZB02738.1 MAG: hypothetical protein B7X67_19165 [Rhizobiales bacterium 39-66-18]